MENNVVNNVRNSFKTNIVVFLAMVYVTFKLTCNPLFFRQITISFDLLDLNLKILSSSLIFPVTYMLSDLTLAISNRKTAITIAIIGIMCDGIFSFIVTFVSHLPIPTDMMALQLKNTYAINQFGVQVWSLFFHGMLATIVSNIAEILIFERVFKKINNFFFSSVFSVALVLFCHNIINDYPMLKDQAAHWQIIFNGILINMTIMVIYALVFSIIIQLKKNLQNAKSA